MEFCPKCGALLLSNDKGKKCPRCGHSNSSKTKIRTSEKVNARKEIVVVDENANDSVHPIMNEKCRKCGNPTSYFWEIQTRSSDESPTKFFKCTKCGHTRRDYR